MGRRLRRLVGVLPGVMLLTSGLARAEDICGVIAATVFITKNSRLTCDVVCANATGPCIQFANDLSLQLLQRPVSRVV